MLSTARAATGSWRDLAHRAALDAARPEGVRAAVRSYTPELGDLTARERQRLLSSVEEILDVDQPYIVPIHTSQPYYAPSMIDDGFAWRRPRIDLDDGRTFEPYEDKLREFHALGPGEQSERFIFTDTRLVPRTGDLTESIQNDIARRRAMYGANYSSSPEFGNVTFAFDPDAMTGATILPATQLLGQYGTRAGTIEHLPGIIASRIAIEGGARSAVERSGMELRRLAPGAVDEVMRTRDEYRQQLSALLALGHDDRIRGVRNIMRNVLEQPHATPNHPVLKLNPIESHVRDLTPQDIRFIDIDMNARVGFIAPQRLDLIEDAALRRGIPTNGIDVSRAQLAQLEATAPTMFAAIEDAPRTNTAIGTAQLRLEMARRRAEAAAS